MMPTPLVAPGPFARLTGLSFPGRRFRFRIVRDDGLEYAPHSGEGITLRLYAATGAWLFSGFSLRDLLSPAYPNLAYEEGVPGLVTAFTYEDGYYSVVLSGPVLWDALGLTEATLRCALVTEGTHTLETFFPRIYEASGVGKTLMAPGTWEVTVPFWSVEQGDLYPNVLTTVRTTTVYSSIPYTCVYHVMDGNALGRFLLPYLGVVWTPNTDLSGWVGRFQVDNVCTQGLIAMPWQYPDITPPAALPTHSGQRVHGVYENVVLQVALGPCPDRWEGTRVNISSEFGYGDVIPFSNVEAPGFQAEFLLGDQPVSWEGAAFVRQYVFQWDQSVFQYDTGEGEHRYVGLTASLVQSPAIDFERLTATPLPEVTE